MIMKLRPLLFCGGVFCLAISFSILIYGRVIGPLFTPSNLEAADPPVSSSQNQDPPTALRETPVTVRRLEPNRAANSRREAAREDARVQRSDSPLLEVEPVRPREQPTPTQAPPPVVAQQPQKVNESECTQRIALLERNEYAYIPPECQDQYRAWRRVKSEQEREQARRQRDAERKADKEKRDAEREKRLEQERRERNLRDLKGLIEGIRRGRP